MRRRAQNSTNYPILFFMTDETDHITGLTGLSPTVTLSKNGESFESAVGTIHEVGNGWYALAGNATDRDTLGTLILHAEATGSDPFDMDIEIGIGSLDIDAIADAVFDESADTHVGLIPTNLDAKISDIPGNLGMVSRTYTLLDSETGMPSVGVPVWATTDIIGLNRVDITRITNDAGQVTFQFNLDEGTHVWIWNRSATVGDEEII